MAAVGSITVTTSRDAPLSKYSIAWTSDGSGDVAENGVTLKTGQIVQVICTPGDTTPSDDYDVTLLTEDGEDDLLGGGGINCSNSLTKVVGLGPGGGDLPVWVPSGTYWPTVAGAGDSKTGTIDIYIA